MCLVSSGTRHIKLLDVRHMATHEPPPLDWIFKGVAARGHLTLFVGAPKDGKSLKVLTCAGMASNGGGAVAGIEVQAAKTLYIDAENGEAEIWRRVHGKDYNHEFLHIGEGRGLDLTRDADELCELCDALGPDVLVLDSWRSLWSGDENKSEEVDACLGPLRSLAHAKGVAIILIHHAPKYDPSTYRGSGSIGAAVEICVMVHNEGETPHKIRRLELGFSRFEPVFDEMWFAITEGAEIVEVDPQDKAPKSENAQKLLDALQDGMTWVEWARAAGKDNRQGAMRNARDTLARREIVVKRDERYYRA